MTDMERMFCEAHLGTITARAKRVDGLNSGFCPGAKQESVGAIRADESLKQEVSASTHHANPALGKEFRAGGPGY